jgi:hypothetical protein
MKRTSRTPRHLAVAAIALAAPLAVASVATAATQPAAGSTTEPSVMVFDQAAKDGKVNISYAYLPKNGYVVVYGTSADGKVSGEPLGSASLKAGDHRDVAVKLSSQPAPGTKLWATIYEDRDGKQGPARGTDMAIWESSALPRENAFTIR